MHRSRTADNLLKQLLLEKGTDAVIISEQYGKARSGTWLQDDTGTAAIWILSSGSFPIVNSGQGNGFVWVKSSKYSVMSCYLTPSDAIAEFETKLDSIEDCARGIGEPLVIAGDFNARAVEWGSSSTDSRGRRILDFASRLGLVVANSGTSTTFRRPGCMATTPDITLVSERLAGALRNWTVLEDYTGSDHQYIEYSIELTSRPEPSNIRRGTRKWKSERLDIPALLTTLDSSTAQQIPAYDSETIVQQTMQSIIRACDVAMPRVQRANRRKSAYWWNEEIAELRSVCLRCRRKLTRSRRLGPAEAQVIAYKTARQALNAAIKTSKKTKWEELRNDINNNPWGMGYKLVMKKLGANPSLPLLDSGKMAEIVGALFPTHPPLEAPSEELSEGPPPLFTLQELASAAGALKNNKSPGPDGVPTEVLKAIAAERPQVLLDMYNACLVEGKFPAVWKQQKLTLISKGKGNPERAEAYRPLCMLDTSGKLLERLIKPRLAAAVESAGGLSPRQHGFRPGHSTLGAIHDVIDTVSTAQRGNHYSRKIVLLATLDVRNAFNSVNWSDIVNTLEFRYQTPRYLMKMTRSYLSDRVLLYDTSDGSRQLAITSGAAQGSILGPDLWNDTYDSILEMRMPDDTHLVAFADDVAAVIVSRDTTEAQRKLNVVMVQVQAWLRDHGLKLAAEKTELLLLTRSHIPLEVPLQVCGHPKSTQRSAKYLGLQLDCRLNYWAQIQHAAKKASRATASLARLMANIGGPTQSKRRLLLTITNTILLYGCEVWAEALEADSRRKVYASVQRTAALRIASAYRTVSEAAVLVISSCIPIDLLAFERRKRWVEKREGRVSTLREARQHTIQQWQERWRTATTGRWTFRLIPNVKSWTERGHGEVNYYLTQLLSGHGYFRKYLFRAGKTEGCGCIYGDADVDDAEHTFFRCQKWNEHRRTAENIMGPIEPENIVEKMLQRKESWDAVTTFAGNVLLEKKRDLDATILEERRMAQVEAQ
ncbi:hypothetical protein ACLKA7_011527 [Drosophila subpalustris]